MTKRKENPKWIKGSRLAWLKEHTNYSSDECLMWPFSKGKNGRGSVWFRGKVNYAAHVMCVLANGDSPTTEHEAAHKCHNGHEGCVNPRHVYWATLSENRRDHFLSPAMKARRDRAMFIKLNSNMGTTELARMFGISDRTVRKIKAGSKWGWV